MRKCIAASLLALLAPAAGAQPADNAEIAPFIAHFQADWKGISVGTSDIQLAPDSEPGRYVYTWTVTARGIFRMAYRDDLVQKSWMSVSDGRVRPEKYRAREGSSTVELDFDWDNKRATGVSETKPVDIALKEGMQDVMSIQVQVMLDLKRGSNLPETFTIIDKDRAKEFEYAKEGTARLKTAIGDLDTVIITSRQAGNNRILKMWFAPTLGYLPVHAERSRDGKVEIVMRIKSADHLVAIETQPTVRSSAK
jgi:Protein of unknown function (DUF3108)